VPGAGRVGSTMAGGVGAASLRVWLGLLGAAALGITGPAAAQVSFSTLYSFSGSGSDGGSPRSTLVFDQAGNLYGTSSQFSAGGYIFELSPPAGGSGAWTETTLYGTNSLLYPPASLIIDSSGDLYGTSSGGSLETKSESGTVFELSPPAGEVTRWTIQVLRNFAGPNKLPGRLLLDSAGNLFGTTANGGAKDGGTVFELTPTPSGWVKTALCSFSASGVPRAGLTADATGHLFGTTSGGGSGFGTVFALTLVPGVGWERSVLYRFTGGADGGAPITDLLMDAAGNLYGTTSAAGANGGGTVFELSPPAIGTGTYAWTETTLLGFGGTEASPAAALVMDATGNLYGVTAGGGSSGFGTLYELSPPASPGSAWTHTILYRFTGSGDGGTPKGGLALAGSGLLYGTTTRGGAHNAGTIFRVTLLGG